jgi:adenylate kinase
MPFTEEDFRRRKPHSSYKEHLAAEKTIIKFGKTNKKKLATFVICSGLIYGLEENLFHYLFKEAWHNQDLLIYGKGRNILPTIHINDLSSVIQNCCDDKPKARYIVAVDDSNINLKQLTKAISRNLGTKKFRIVDKEDAVLNKDISQSDFDMLMVDLRMDSAYIKENMQIKWTCENGMIENVNKLVKEYKAARKLIVN